MPKKNKKIKNLKKKPVAKTSNKIKAVKPKKSKKSEAQKSPMKSVQAAQPVAVDVTVVQQEVTYAPTTPAYSLIFNSVKAEPESAPEEATEEDQQPVRATMRIVSHDTWQKYFLIIASVTLTAILLGFFWIKVTLGYFDSRKDIPLIDQHLFSEMQNNFSQANKFRQQAGAEMDQKLKDIQNQLQQTQTTGTNQ